MSDSITNRWYEETYQFIYTHPLDGLDWPDITTAVTCQQLRNNDSISRYASVLPTLVCNTVGGKASEATPLSASWILYDLASNIFDDLQDNDVKPLPWNSWSLSRAMNVGLGLIAAAQFCLTLIETTLDAKQEIQKEMARSFLLASQGQGLSKKEPLLNWYFEHILTKSGLVFATIAWAGVRTHSQDPDMLGTMHDFGLALGTLIQIADDCYDLVPNQSLSDLSNRVYTLPVIYGLSQKDHPLHARLTTLLEGKGALDSNELEETNQILINMGAVSYSLSVAKVYEQKALDALDTCHIMNGSYLRNYVSQLLPTYPTS